MTTVTCPHCLLARFCDEGCCQGGALGHAAECGQLERLRAKSRIAKLEWRLRNAVGALRATRRRAAAARGGDGSSASDSDAAGLNR